MKIYTSYFGRVRALVDSGIRPICVALVKPRYCNDMPQLVEVAPTRYMISDRCSRDEYLELYGKILAGLDRGAVMERIRSLSGGKDVALCCYERPGDFCHRHILARWLSEGAGMDIVEFGYERDLFGEIGSY